MNRMCAYSAQVPSIFRTRTQINALMNAKDHRKLQTPTMMRRAAMWSEDYVCLPQTKSVNLNNEIIIAPSIINVYRVYLFLPRARRLPYLLLPRIIPTLLHHLRDLD